MAIHRIRLPFRGPFPKLQLSTGERHKVVLVRPKLSPMHYVPGFHPGSSFPALFVLPDLRAIAEFLDADPNHRSVFFGHTDASGSVAKNKELADRRAQATLALAVSKPDQLWEIAQRENWSDEIYQALLRLVGFICGPVDGIVGKLTRSALAAFADATRNGWLFDLDAIADEDPQSFSTEIKRALIATYIHEYGLELDEARVLGPKFGGCLDYNHQQKDKQLARAVSIARVGPDDGYVQAGDFPCQAGDAGACALDRGQGLRCAFYRFYFVDELMQNPPSFFDFRWHRLAPDRIYLSAVTNGLDCDDVEFEICWVTFDPETDLPCSENHGAAQVHEIIATVKGTIKMGVCEAIWREPSVDPFDMRVWMNADPDQAPLEPRVPSFCIKHAGYYAYAPPPGHRLDRLATSRYSSGESLVELADGTFAWIEEGDPEDVGQDEALTHLAHAIAVLGTGWQNLRYGDAPSEEDEDDS